MKTRWLLLLGLLTLILLGFVLRKHGWEWSPRRVREDVQPSNNTVVCFGRVDVEGSVTGLSTVQPGRVCAVYVAENIDVEAGTVLLRVENELAKLRLCEAEIGVRSAVERLERSRTQVQRQVKQVAQQKGAIKVARHRRMGSELLVVRKRNLVQLKLLDQIELSAAEEENHALHALELVETARLAELELNDPQRAVRQAELDQETAKNREVQARQLLADCEVKAPKRGTVLRLLAAVGDVLGTPAKPIAVWFVPRQPYLVRAEVDQEFASRVTVGLPALISEEGSETTAWTGQVLRMSRWVHPRRSIVTDPFVINDTRTVECLVSIDVDRRDTIQARSRTLNDSLPFPRLGQRMRVHINPPEP